MKIGELAEAAGVNVQTVRYYERRRLLPEAQRTPSGYREYEPSDVRRLSFVRRAKELGFTLSEVAELLDLRVRGGTTADDVRVSAVRKLDSTRRKMRDLRRIAAALERLISTCDAHGSPEACALMHALETDEEV